MHTGRFANAALTALYPMLMPGRAIVIDDWYLLRCRIATNSYRKQHGIIDPIEVTAENGYWFKSQAYAEPL